MADMTETIARLRALLDHRGCNHVEPDAQCFLAEALVEVAPALLDAADRTRLHFGPWFEGERHAVAADGARYTIIRLLNERFGIALGSGWTYSAESATEAESIAAAQAHDLARRGGK